MVTRITYFRLLPAISVQMSGKGHHLDEYSNPWGKSKPLCVNILKSYSFNGTCACSSFGYRNKLHLPFVILWELTRVYENYLRDFGEELKEICEGIQKRETRIFEEYFSLDWFSVYNIYINRSSKENKTMRMNKLMKTRSGEVTFG